jgi:hypothetical protein
MPIFEIMDSWKNDFILFSKISIFFFIVMFCIFVYLYVAVDNFSILNKIKSYFYKNRDLKIAMGKTKDYIEDCKKINLDNNTFDLTNEMHRQVILNELLIEHFQNVESVHLKAANIQLKNSLLILETNLIEDIAKH